MPRLFPKNWTPKPRPTKPSMTTTKTWVRKRIKELVATKPMRYGDIIDVIVAELDGSAARRLMTRKDIRAMIEKIDEAWYPDGHPPLYVQAEVE